MPRPSSPVHAKASTKCSYLTLENPHHQRQACIKTCRLQMARRIISARYYICKCRIAAFPGLQPYDRSQRATAMRHGIDLKTHSQCQRRGHIPLARPQVSLRPDLVFHPGEYSAHFFAKAAKRILRSSLRERRGWWSLSGSNRRPQACKASALPTELWPLTGSTRREWWA